MHEYEVRYRLLRLQLRALYKHDQYGMHAKVLDLHARLISRHPDARSYQLFHLLSGSTPKDSMQMFDFPGEDSVESFIKREWAAAFPERVGLGPADE